MSDRLANDQQMRMPNVLDISTRKCLLTLPARSLIGKAMAHALDRLARRHGYSEKVVSDNGIKFKL